MIRSSLFIATAIVAATSIAPARAAGPPTTGLPSGLVLSLLGVNTHLNYSDGYGFYADIDTVEADLAYLGVKSIRDGLPAPHDSTYQLELQSLTTLAKAGYNFDLIFRDWQQPISYDQRQFDIVEGDAPGSVAALEGLNERNNENPEPTMAQAEAFQKAIYGLTQPGGDANAKGLSVFTYTDASDVPNAYGQPNAHTYPYGGEAALPRDQQEFDNDFGFTPQPVFTTSPFSQPAHYPVISETGAYVEADGQNRTDQAYEQSVDAREQAIQDVDSYFDGVALGATRTMIYQLVDNYPDPDGDEDDQEYGLFGGSNGRTPTLAAQAIQEVTHVLGGGESTYAAVDCINYTVAGLTSTEHVLPIQKNEGDYVFLVWNEATNWNASTHSRVVVPRADLTFAFKYPTTLAIYDALDGEANNPIASDASATSFKVQVSDEPLMVVVHPSVTNDTSCPASTD